MSSIPILQHFSYVVLEEDFEDITEGVKKYAEESMKIEMVPWVRNYAVKMGELYTELTVEKIEDKPTGPESEVISDYRELFKQEHSSVDPRKRKGRFRKREKGKRFLVKADPGLGKTTFCKKLAWDCAKEYFTSFSIVIFVRLKLVKAGQSIEDVLIQQCPSLRQQAVGPHDVRQLLDRFGERCLIILDGFDEFDPQKNESIKELIVGQTFPQCSVLVTSRPHAIADIEPNFENVLRIKGFNKEHTDVFCAKVLTSKDKEETALLFYANNFMRGDITFASPMLLQFICILVSNDPDLDLARKNVARGDIYWRLARCIYRKYCKSRNVGFNEEKLTNVLDKIGKFALKTMKDRQSSFRREEIIQELGENVFQYGFLVGYEDFRLAANETADILVTFIHETMRTFLAYFHLHHRDCSGETKRIWNTVCSKDLTEMFDKTDEGYLLSQCIEDIDCLHFYLSLSKHNESTAFGVELIAMFIERLWHCKTLDFINTHKINIFQAVFQKDDLSLAFLRKVLAECWTPEYLSFSAGQPINWILESFHHLRDQIKLIIIYAGVPHDIEILRSLRKRKVIIDVEVCSEVASIFKFFQEPFDLVVHTQYEYVMIDMSEMMGPHVHQLQIIGHYPFKSPTGICEAPGDLPCCSNLTHLVLSDVRLTPFFVRALYKAMRNGHLPLLEHLSFEGCIFFDEQSYGYKFADFLRPADLFEAGCPTLACLNVKRCQLKKNQFELIFLCLRNENKFSKFRGLELSLDSYQLLPQCPWTNIKSVWVHELDISGYKISD